jgi:hypothetical protein
LPFEVIKRGTLKAVRRLSMADLRRLPEALWSIKAGAKDRSRSDVMRFGVFSGTRINGIGGKKQEIVYRWT